VQLSPAFFCQPVDIAISLEGNTTQAIPNMDGYPMRSADNAIAYIADILALGVRTVMIRMDAPLSFANTAAVLERQAAIIKQIRQQYDTKTLDIIVDPFSVALNADKTWGVVHEGELHYSRTLELFATITDHFVKAGATYVLTLGRFEREVDVTKRTIDLTQADTKVASFSTNTETTNAYVYADHGAYAITKQKILVSNYQEMVFRALVDLHEGSQLLVIKPAENLHVLERVKTLLHYPALLQSFLQSARITALASSSVYLSRVRDQILSDIPTFLKCANTAGLAAYTVSGTYFMDMQTAKRKGEAFLTSLLYERFCNIAGVLDDWNGPKLIIDRNAARFIARHSA
jgi:porphobilinogen synthase